MAPFSSGTTSTVVTAPPRPLRETIISTEPRQWPQPELSIGTRCGSMDVLGRWKCWEIKEKSPAYRVWKLVSKAIIDLLEDQFEHLDAKGKDFMFEMFMIGRRASTSKPTILFSCENKTPRQRAIHLVEKSAVLAPHPGVLMAQCSRLPRLYAGNDATSLAPPGVYVNGPLSMSVVVISDFGESRKATLGGVLLIDGQFFGLTANHAFLSAQIVDMDPAPDLEFEFFDSSAFSHDFDEDESVLMTSHGSISSNESSPSQLSESIPVKTSRDDGLDGTQGEVDTWRSALATGLSQQNTKGHTFRRIGSLYEVTRDTLDWALVKIEDADFIAILRSGTLECLNHNALRLGYVDLFPLMIVDKPSDIDVLISGIPLSEGTLSAVAAFQKLQGYSEGDCGSWVIGQQRDKFYGHLVSGRQNTGIGYIVPAFQVIQEIQLLFGPEKGISMFSFYPDPHQKEFPNITQSEEQSLSLAFAGLTLSEDPGKSKQPLQTSYLTYHNVRLQEPDIDWLERDWVSEGIIAFYEEYLERGADYQRASAAAVVNIVLLRPSIVMALLHSLRMAHETENTTHKTAGILPNLSRTTHIFIPLPNSHSGNMAHRDSHWSLLLVSVIDSKAFHYDSWIPRNEKNAHLVLRGLEGILGKTIRYVGLGPKHSPQLEYSSDSGIYVCIAMHHLLINRLLDTKCTQEVSMSMGGSAIDAWGAREDLLAIIEGLRKGKMEAGT
ncbi:NEDD8-specific protease [Lachnellula suecica]|uniref:NEDD8-specific protease n=1 Tax=Lachnellula suecica TaxID=602035 RepID=A0A8T9CJS5_9HELO|nr:NEDD8-specific protease [Lachnellula suecica]